MKRVLKLIAFGVILIIGIIIIFGLYNFFVLGQKDFGLVNEYHYCENGSYYTRPQGVQDGSSTYYGKGKELITTCHSMSLENTEVCTELARSARLCAVHGFKIPFSSWF